jgi:hypothetical protein
VTRRGDWQEISWKYIREHMDTPFEWGVQDCATFACGHIEAITGVDLMLEFKGNYTTLDEGMEKAKEVFGEHITDYEDAVAAGFKRAGLQELPSVMFAQRGDAVLFDDIHGATLGVVHLDGVHVCVPRTKGISLAPLEDCRRAWRV